VVYICLSTYPRPLIDSRNKKFLRLKVLVFDVGDKLSEPTPYSQATTTEAWDSGLHVGANLIEADQADDI
jgi:hypothetical protein